MWSDCLLVLLKICGLCAVGQLVRGLKVTVFISKMVGLSPSIQVNRLDMRDKAFLVICVLFQSYHGVFHPKNYPQNAGTIWGGVGTRGFMAVWGLKIKNCKCLANLLILTFWLYSGGVGHFLRTPSWISAKKMCFVTKLKVCLGQGVG